MTEMQVSKIKPITEIDEETPLSEEEQEIYEGAKGKVMLFHLSGPMSFSSAKAMVRRQSGTAGYEVMLLDLTSATSLDFASARHQGHHRRHQVHRAWYFSGRRTHAPILKILLKIRFNQPPPTSRPAAIRHHA